MVVASYSCAATARENYPDKPGGLIVRRQFECRYKHFIVSVLLISLFLGACKASPVPEPTIVVSFLSDPAFTDLENYIDLFEAAHPEIQINVTYRQEISKEWPRHFDTALVPGTLNNYQTDLLLNLAPLIESDPQFGADDYLPGALSTGYVEGYLVALPVSLSFDVLVYNSRQLNSAGAALPASDWSWEDFRNIATILGRHHDGGSGAVFADTADPSIFLFGWLQEQTHLYENVDGRFTPLLDHPGMQSALLDACQILSELRVEPDASSLVSERLSRLQAGEAAMTILPQGLARNIAAAYPDLVVATLPHPSRSLRADGALVISRGTAHPHAAWEWIQFLSHQYLSRGAFDLPARKSVATNQRVWDTLDTELAQALQAILADRTAPETERYQEPLQIIKIELWDALFKTCYRGVPANTALKNAQEQAQDKLAEWYATQAAEPTPFSVAAPVTADKRGQTLNFVALDGNEEFYRSVAEAFKASRPEWSVQFGGLNPEEIAKADCVSIRMRTFDTFMLLDLQDSFLSIRSMTELAPMLDEDNFFPQAIKAVSWRGQLLAVPVAVQPLVLYYDPEVFLGLGLSFPTSEWTVADVLDAAAKIIATAPSRLGYAPREGAEVRFVLEQQGISLFSPGPLLEPRFTAPDVVSAIERLRTLQGGQGVLSSQTPAMALSTFFGSLPLQSHWRAVALEPYPDTHWPVTLFLVAVNKESSNVQMAWEWIAFVAQWDGVWSDDVLPSVRTLAVNDKTYLALAKEQHTAYLTALERATPGADSEKAIIQDIAATWFYGALQEITSGDLEPALEQAQAKAQAFIDCQASVGTVELQTLVTCARQVDPEHWLAKLQPGQ